MVWLVGMVWGTLGSQLLFFNSSVAVSTITRLSYPLTVTGYPYLLLTLSTRPPSDIPFPALLLADINIQPYIHQESNSFDLSAAYFDLVSFALHKNTSYLQLNISALSPGDTIFTELYLPQRPLSGLPYQLSGTGHFGDLCPAGCSAHGVCEAGKCVCEFEWKGVDCGVKVTGLSFDQQYDLSIEAGTYRYFQPESIGDSLIRLKLEKIKGDVELLVALGSSSMLPTVYSSDSSQIIPNTTGNHVVLVDSESVGMYGLTFAVYCPNTDTQSTAMVTILFSESSSGTSANIYIIVGILLGAGIMCICCCLICLRLICKHRSRKAARVHIYQSWGFSNLSDQEKILQGFEVPFDPRKPQTCTICLEDMLEQPEITMLPCKHTFHTGCISSWFEKQDFCCVCKATYDISRNYE